MSIFSVFFLFATWTSVFAIGKITLQTCPPVFLTAVRMLLAGFILMSYLLIKKKKSLKVTFKQFIAICALAIFSIYLTNIFEFWGLQYLSSAKTCFIYSLSPFFAAFFSYLHFNEKMNKQKWIGLFIGSLGFIPVLLSQSSSENLFKGFSFITLPELAIMGAALFSVYGWVLLRLLVKENSISPLMANGASMLIGGTIALIHSLCVDTYNPLPILPNQGLVFSQGVFIMTFVSNILCYNLYGWLLKRYTATFLSFAGLLSPIFASLTGWLFLKEKPSLIILASTAIVISGLWLVYKAELKQGYILNKKRVIQESSS